MFIGEMDYNDLEFDHWLGYVIFILFAFLLVIVLMNILNGLAVSDIHKIQEEVDTYYHISIVETLARYSLFKIWILYFKSKKNVTYIFEYSTYKARYPFNCLQLLFLFY